MGRGGSLRWASPAVNTRGVPGEVFAGVFAGIGYGVACGVAHGVRPSRAISLVWVSASSGTGTGGSNNPLAPHASTFGAM